MDVISVNLAAIPKPTESTYNNNGYVYWGCDDKYPLFLQNLYNSSPTLRTIIDGYVAYIMGGGVITSSENTKALLGRANEYGNTLEDVVELAVLDYMIYGGFAVHVGKSLNNNIISLQTLDFSRVRVSEDEKRVFYLPPYDNNVYNSDNVRVFVEFFAKANTDLVSVYYNKGNKTRSNYPKPLYYSAITAIMTDIELQKKQYKDIVTNFSPNLMLQFFNGEPTEEERIKIERKLKEKFMGNDNNEQLNIVMFFHDKIEHKIDVQPLETMGDARKIIEIRKAIKEDLFTAMRVTSPAIFGMKPENTGLTENDFSIPAKIFEKTIISNLRRQIVLAFRTLLQDETFDILPYNFNF